MRPKSTSFMYPDGFGDLSPERIISPKSRVTIHGVFDFMRVDVRWEPKILAISDQGSNGWFHLAATSDESNQVDQKLNGQSGADHDACKVGSDPRGIFDDLESGRRLQSLTLHHFACSHLVLIEGQTLISQWVIHVDQQFTVLLGGGVSQLHATCKISGFVGASVIFMRRLE